MQKKVSNNPELVNAILCLPGQQQFFAGGVGGGGGECSVLGEFQITDVV